MDPPACRRCVSSHRRPLPHVPAGRTANKKQSGVRHASFLGCRRSGVPEAGFGLVGLWRADYAASVWIGMLLSLSGRRNDEDVFTDARGRISRTRRTSLMVMRLRRLRMRLSCPLMRKCDCLLGIMKQCSGMAVMCWLKHDQYWLQ